MTARSVKEWIGASPDSPIPPRVKLRVFERYGGRCYLARRKIEAGEAWDCDHIIALCNGGENRESNLAPALRDKHREKTKADVAEKAKVARVRKKFLGLDTKPKAFQSKFKRKVNGQTVEREA